MKSSQLALIKPKSAQRGVTAVEFALVAIPFLLLLFGAIEFGRLLYVWNTVQEVTRNAARQAVVTDFRNLVVGGVGEIDRIKCSSVFSPPATNPANCLLPAASGITGAMVNIRYLDSEEEPISKGKMPSSPGANIEACIDGKDNCIRFVEVCVSTDATCAASGSISFKPMIGLFSQTGTFSIDLTGLKIPLSTVRMPAESLGFRP